MMRGDSNTWLQKCLEIHSRVVPLSLQQARKFQETLDSSSSKKDRMMDSQEILENLLFIHML